MIGLVVVALTVGSTTSGAAPPGAVARAAAVEATTARSSVGPLFVSGLGSAYTCTASVVASRPGDVIVTAAHCLSGTGAGVLFAPGYQDGVAPYGTWAVVAAYVDSGWTRSQDPGKDYVFLVVAPSASNVTSGSVQSVVGGETLARAPVAGTQVTVTGYPAGPGGASVVCSAPVILAGPAGRGPPSFRCAGYVAGTSGAPWVVAGRGTPGTSAGTVTGVIGGLDQGGCSAGTSYTSAFDRATFAVYGRAVRGGPADVLPQPGGDGC